MTPNTLIRATTTASETWTDTERALLYCPARISRPSTEGWLS
jgi:hypothetical protein